MKKSVSVIGLFIAIFIFSGCIVSNSPTDKNVTVHPGETKNFSVQVMLPELNNYRWILDGNIIDFAIYKSYNFSPDFENEGDHTLTIQAVSNFFGTTQKSWNIHVPGESANLITNPGFESCTDGDPTVTWPPISDFGVWSGDSTQIVRMPLNGITPLEGSYMLQFINAGGVECDLYQFIDLSNFQEEITGGTSFKATYKANFNRVDEDSETDTEFGIEMYTLTGDPSAFQPGSVLPSVDEALYTDANPDTWQELAATITLPEGTEYILIHISATENVINDEVDPEFDGHYADKLSLKIEPE